MKTCIRRPHLKKNHKGYGPFLAELVAGGQTLVFRAVDGHADDRCDVCGIFFFCLGTFDDVRCFTQTTLAQ